MKVLLSIILALQGSLAAASSSVKFGIVDMQKVILEVAEGKEAVAQLRKEISAKEKELTRSKDSLEGLGEELKKQSPLLSEDAKARKQRDFQEKLFEFRQAEAAFQNEIKQKEQQATSDIASKASRIVQDLAQTSHLSAVFEASSMALLYVDSPEDLTSKVIARYDLAHKVSVSPLKKAKNKG
jgi:outer membrane protein